jgi:predicted transcriptional regulator
MSEAILNDIHKTLKEQLRWTRFIGVRQLKDDERIVYELSDGEKSTREIEGLTKVSRTTVARLWDKWYKLGLMERSEKYGGGRMKHSFSLADAGIEVPSLPAAEQPQQAPQPKGELT